MSQYLWKNLSDSLLELYRTSQLYDVEITAGGPENSKVFKAHSAILDNEADRVDISGRAAWAIWRNVAQWRHAKCV